MRKASVVVAGAAGLMFAAAAMAAPQGKPARLDPNASVSRSDTLAMMNQRFDRIDTNADGMIDPAEMAAHRETMKTWRAKRQTAQAATRAEGAAAEANEAATAARREAWAKFAKAREEARRARGQLGFAMRDADGDGLISRDEFTAPALRRFDRADADGDGVVTPAERAAAREARRSRRG